MFFSLLIAYNFVQCEYNLFVTIDKDKPDLIQYISMNTFSIL